MSGRPSTPRDALSPEELQRFVYACSHERHSPTTHRMIDAASYGWIHVFIRNNGEEAPAEAPSADWLDLHDADPAKLEGFFGRVAIRLRNTGAFDYATSLQEYFHGLAETHQFP
ncbi:MAG: hypothetical protein ACRDWS_15340 [Acidimicrobiia bacterium]